MPVELLLQRLHGVRQRGGPGQWSARCPAHDDSSPSLSIRQRDDGALLLHCFGGCSVEAIVGSVGLQLADLFPPRPCAPGGRAAPARRPWTAAKLLDLAAFESTICVMVTADLLEGRPADRGRMLEAARRLLNVAEAARA